MTGKGKRVLFAGLFHETHTFLEQRTALSDFALAEGPALLDLEGDASPMGAALVRGRALGWTMVPTIDMRATPSGLVEADVVEHFWLHFRRRALPALEGGVDGLFLVLHGAMAAEGIDDVEGELLKRMGSLCGADDLPVCGVLDLHGNISAQTTELSDGLIAYRENPHVDARETAVRAADLLDRLMNEKRRARSIRLQTPVLWPPTGTGTADDPMRALESLARRIETEEDDIEVVNVFAGFSFSDTPDAGVAFSAVTLGDPERAARRLKELGELTFELRESGNPRDPDLESVMPLLKALGEGPALIVEPADNIGGGAPGDGTPVLRALLDHRMDNAGVVMNDPDAVRTLASRAPGDRLRLPVGGRGSSLDPGPVELELELVSLSDGRFELEDPQSHLASMVGRHVDMGLCAVARTGGVTLLLTSRKTPPFDLGQWRSQGLAPENFSVIGVKAAVAHRRAYDPIAKASFTVDTPGPCSSNLKRLPYRKIRRPVYPLDEFDGGDA